MSEIKGQLLGMILVLVIFGTVSVAIAQVFKTSRDRVTSEATDITDPAETVLNSRPLLTYGE